MQMTSTTTASESDVEKLRADADIRGYDPGAQSSERQPGQVKLDMAVVGQTGLRHTGGFIDEELLIDLRGTKGRRVFKEMSDNSPVVGALLFALSALFRSVKWTVQAADESTEAEEAATFLEEVLDDMNSPLDSVMTEVASMFIYGFAPIEILYKKRVGPKESDPTKRSRFTDNKIGLRGLPMRAQATVFKWEINDESGDIIGLWQQPISGRMLFIPIEKLLLFRTTDAGNNPEGRSLLRNAYRPWYYQKRIEEIEAIGLERDAAGLPIVRIPASFMDPTADENDKAIYRSYVQLARGIKRDTNEGIVLPSNTDPQGKLLFDITLLSTAGSRSMDTTKVLERYDRQIAMSALADFIFLGQSSVGSFALSSDKTALFGQALGSFLGAVAGVLNRYLLPRLWELNAMDEATMPQFHFEDVEKPDLAALSSFVSSLSSAGAPMFPDRELENHLREAGGLPLAPEEGTEDFALRQGQMPGMALGPDGEPLPAAGLEDQRTADQRKHDEKTALMQAKLDAKKAPKK